MSDVVIKVENLGKQYRLGEVGTGTLGSDLNRAWARLRGKEDPFAKIGETNDRTTKGNSDFVWSLKDINFEVRAGEVLGIIGRNGAGKSTLLKILSKITAPTLGSVKIRGRIASLLEVGTGFHPELTGRENIFLNGAILGMTKTEIKSKFDEIVDFSGVERYIDTPVKRYSSGMYVRLAFAVAAFLEPEILIVDEVLAVGDAEFQKKCLGRMKDVSVNDGRTVLFVSHQLNAVASLCSSVLYLKNGTIKSCGRTDEIIRAYSADNKTFSKNIQILSDNKVAWVSDFKLVDLTSQEEYVHSGNPCQFKVSVTSLERVDNVVIGIGINDEDDRRIFTIFSRYFNVRYTLKKGVNVLSCKIDNILIKPGVYNIEILVANDSATLDYYDHGLQIEVLPAMDEAAYVPDSSQGSVVINQIWA